MSKISIDANEGDKLVSRYRLNRISSGCLMILEQLGDLKPMVEAIRVTFTAFDEVAEPGPVVTVHFSALGIKCAYTSDYRFMSENKTPDPSPDEIAGTFRRGGILRRYILEHATRCVGKVRSGLSDIEKHFAYHPTVACPKCQSFMAKAGDEHICVQCGHVVRTHVLVVDVDEDQPWMDAVQRASTIGGEYNVLHAGDGYPLSGKGVLKKKLTLVNFPNGDGNFDEAVAWSKIRGLKRTDPRNVFATAVKNPELNKQLGFGPEFVIYVAATKEHIDSSERRGMCLIWWQQAERRASLDAIVDSHDFHLHWFAFEE